MGSPGRKQAVSLVGSNPALSFWLHSQWVSIRALLRCPLSSHLAHCHDPSVLEDGEIWYTQDRAGETEKPPPKRSISHVSYCSIRITVSSDSARKAADKARVSHLSEGTQGVHPQEREFVFCCFPRPFQGAKV